MICTDSQTMRKYDPDPTKATTHGRWRPIDGDDNHDQPRPPNGHIVTWWDSCVRITGGNHAA